MNRLPRKKKKALKKEEAKKVIECMKKVLFDAPIGPFTQEQLDRAKRITRETHFKRYGTQGLPKILGQSECKR